TRLLRRGRGVAAVGRPAELARDVRRRRRLRDRRTGGAARCEGAHAGVRGGSGAARRPHRPPRGGDHGEPVRADRLSRQAPAARPPGGRGAFAGADVFATAERGERLGAKVLTPAYEAGPVQLAALTDPQGAEFTVSRYAPTG